MRYEIKVNGTWQSVDVNIWRSWAGGRKVDGRIWYGPVFRLGTHEVVRRSTYLSRKAA